MVTIGVLAFGVAGAAVALLRERSAATQRDARAAEVAAVALSESVSLSMASLQGVDGLAADGEVSSREFAAFASGVLVAAPFNGLAYAEPVGEPERAAVEAEKGFPIVDTDGRGGFTVAQPRPEHVVVVDVEPDEGMFTRLLGFDFVSDPVRDEARVRSAGVDGPVLSAPIKLASTAGNGVFVTNRVRAPNGAVVGYVSSGVNVRDLLKSPLLQLPRNTRLAIFDGDEPLTPDEPVDGEEAPLAAGGRSWRVIADDPDDTHNAPAVVIASASVLVAAGVWWSLRRERRFIEVRERSAARNQLIADLGGQLAAASDLGAIADAFNAGAAPIVDAAATEVAWLEPGTSAVRVFSGRGSAAGGEEAEGAPAPTPSTVPLDAGLPIVDCVVNGRPLVLSRLDHEQLYPDLVPELVEQGTDTVACWPLQGFTRPVLGAVRFMWDRPPTISTETRAAMSTLTQLLARTLERASLTELEQQRSQALSRLAQALAGAISRESIGAAVADHLPSVVNANRAQLLVVDDANSVLSPLEQPAGGTGPLGDEAGASPLGDEPRADSLGDTGAAVGGGSQAGAVPGAEQAVTIAAGSNPAADAFLTGKSVTYGDLAPYLGDYPHLAGELTDVEGRATALLPLRQGDGRALGVLSIGWPAPTRFDPTLRATLAVVADLVAQAFQRAALHDTEHSLVADLQNRLLVPMPTATGIQHAARYEPATQAIGMGGDWYDGIVLPDGSLVVVIGDVTGHGATAVAAMAQLQTLIAGLVRVGTPLGSVLATANSMLNSESPHDRIYATAQLLHLDTARGVIGQLSAGHPPALLRGPDGHVDVLDRALQPPIGTRLQPSALRYMPFPPGSVVLAYTDGLIERRGEPITASISRLAAALAAFDGALELWDALSDVIDRARKDSPDTNDDDYAALLVRRTA